MAKLHSSKKVIQYDWSRCLWHLDGVKLLRWSFVIHGCLDGIHVLLQMMKCTNSNKSTAALDIVKAYGLLLHVKSEYGGKISKLLHSWFAT